MKRKLALGLDFGTLSVRALLLDLECKEEAGQASFEYPHGVISGSLPDGRLIPKDYALAWPGDYLSGLVTVTKQVMRAANARAEEIAGIGIDVTSATVLPVTEEGQPLCLLPQFASSPHAFIKLWKHHGAAKVTERMEKAAREGGEEWLSLLGGKISCETFLPKVIETQEMDQAVYRRCFSFQEAGDWLVWRMTGQCIRSRSMAASNSVYRQGKGYPSDCFFGKVTKNKESVLEKLKGRFVGLGECAGYLTEETAKKMELLPGTPVAAPMIDSHAAVIGCGADRVGDLTAVMGTSACYLMNSHTGEGIPGIYSSAYEAHIPEMFGYEGGQSCVGECLDWFANNCATQEYRREAMACGMDIHSFLQARAKNISPMDSQITVLDWMNGVRSPFMQPELTGAVWGLTIHTRPEELYLAAMEGICFGAKTIIDVFGNAGHGVERFFAAGGISGKSPLLMQMLADVCGMQIQVPESRLTSARGSAIMGAIVSGSAGGKTPAGIQKDWIHRLGSEVSCIYSPNSQNHYCYSEKYKRYGILSDFLRKVDGGTESIRREEQT